MTKWNELGFRPSLCTYGLNWARSTSWVWWDDTVLQTQDSKFEPWRSEADHATSRPRRLPTILTFTRGWGRNIFCFSQNAETGNRTRALAWKAAVLTTNLGPPPLGWLNFCVSHKCYGPTRAKVPVLAMIKTCSGGDRCRYRTCWLKRKHRRDVLTNLRGIVGEVLAKFRRIFSDA